MELNNAISQYPVTNIHNLQARDDFSRSSTQADETNSSTKTNDSVKISQEGKDAAAESSDRKTQSQSSNEEEFTEEEVAQLTELKARDLEVRAHEQAHLAAAGGYATGGASFSYQKGPDGQSYAVGGEVGIDLSEENDPNATVQKMQTIQRAALAPATPSSTDRQVAAQAEVIETQARQEILQKQQEQLLQTEESSVDSTEAQTGDNTSKTVSPSISSLKASISAYEQMAAM